MNFASDNIIGVHPSIMEAIAAANEGVQNSYGQDEYTARALKKLADVFETEVAAFLVLTGTGANSLALSALSPPYGCIVCHAESHILVDECGAPEMFSSGAGLLGLADPHGKLRPDSVARKVDGFTRGVHNRKPAAVSITQASELGTVYTVEEISALAECARARKMKLHMDGARFANALVRLGCTPSEMTWKAGVDALSFGCTKNGAMMLEAVIFFDRALAADFGYRRMRGAQLASKGRFLGAQMLAYLEDDLWLENARRANRMARHLANGLTAAGTVRLAAPVEANELFAVMPRALFGHLADNGARLGEWPASAAGEAGPGEGEALVRLVCSCMTTEDECDRLAAAVSAWQG
jgi:threonine aldolase